MIAVEKSPERIWEGGQNSGRPVLEVVGLRKFFPITRGIFRRVAGHVKAVNDVSFTVGKGEILGLVGESGCGKTTTGRCIIRLLDPTDGHAYFGEEGTDLATASREQLKALRPRMQMIFQDPYSSLNPRMTVGEIIGEPLRVNRICTGSELEDRVGHLLKSVELRGDYIRRYPHAFSGGQRQRIGIARALALNPELIIADEPVSALDVSVQAQVLNLLSDLRREHNLSFIFIAHDLSVVEHFSDRVAVMYLGTIVEISESKALYSRPRHPYTESLMSAIPVPDPVLQRSRTRIKLEGEVPDIAKLPSGCTFHPRCRYVKDICRTEVPMLREVSPGVKCACHCSDELSLQGI